MESVKVGGSWGWWSGYATQERVRRHPDVCAGHDFHRLAKGPCSRKYTCPTNVTIIKFGLSANLGTESPFRTGQIRL